MDIVSRQDAKAQGLKRFYTGIPCTHGHICERYTSINKCVDCARIEADKWKSENKDKVSEYNKRYNKENEESVKAGQEDWLRRNPEYFKIKGRSPEHKAAVKKWGLSNPDKRRSSVENRRARKQNAEGYYKDDDVMELLRMQYGLCGSCGCSLEESGYHVDHIVPLSKGGSNWPDNLQLLCPTCNVSKGAKLPEEWAGYLP